MKVDNNIFTFKKMNNFLFSKINVAITLSQMNLYLLEQVFLKAKINFKLKSNFSKITF
jgi:hypothetical protein